MDDKGISITHPGTVVEVTAEQIKVRILAQSACVSCHAKGMCSVADMEEKIVDVQKPSGLELKPGDKVTLFIKQSKGNLAVFYAYLLPFLVFFAILLIMSFIQENEGLSAIVALVSLIPYYFILYLQKDKFRKRFVFYVKE
ncbi:MAG: SoxR reducing system RseC family protein [Bacteroidetes bacterium]|nr:SoxR reducing system RseC family protein [Bacteroidota bacterium]